MAVIESYTLNTPDETITFAIHNRGDAPPDNGIFDRVTWTGTGGIRAYSFRAFLLSDPNKTPITPTPITFTSRNGQQNILGDQPLYWDEAAGYWQPFPPTVGYTFGPA